MFCVFSFISVTKSIASETTEKVRATTQEANSKNSTTDKANKRKRAKTIPSHEIQSQKTSSPPATYTDPLTGMEFVYIEGGCFYTGIELRNNGPENKTCINSFYMGKYEVTQEQWLKVMKENPSEHKGANLPVENTTWDGVHTFLKKLNERSSFHFRLPSNHEWEYAARAGVEEITPYWGDDKSKACLYANLAYHGTNLMQVQEEYPCKDGFVNSSAPVGSFLPNPYGLYDMLGNTDEWCPTENERDFNPYGVPNIDQSDPYLAFGYDEDYHTICGGSYFLDPSFADTSSQSGCYPDSELCASGVRLVLEER